MAIFEKSSNNWNLWVKSNGRGIDPIGSESFDTGEPRCSIAGVRSIVSVRSPNRLENPYRRELVHRSADFSTMPIFQQRQIFCNAEFPEESSPFGWEPAARLSKIR
jgi:hypothetical protein